MNGRHVIRAVVSGTKTGGHLYPAVAVGRKLEEKGMEVTLVASGEAAEGTILGDSGLSVIVLRVGRLKGAGPLGRLKGAASIPVGLVRAAALLRRLRPHLVVGFGGYTTGPLVLAAALMGIPSAICEENSIPGLTNRILARFVSRVFVAYETTAKRLAARRVSVTGTPLRPDILAVVTDIGTGPEPRVLVCGGSQGSAFLNERIPPVIGRVVESIGPVKVRHQTGLGNGGEVKERYESIGVRADVVEYIHDMAGSYGDTDFVVCRSGAGTVSEISAVGLPALFVPFAAAADGHQVENASGLVDAGGAFMVEERDFDESAVAGMIGGVLRDGEGLRRMGRASASCGRRDALDVMVGELEAMVAA